ncbi:uncharacterized protein LOC115763641 isoform X3 [Drosophila novamexicana]|uniref:uncharacterized protein LOC115763641 isoform X3 n=1 Tax=Drosophila novamexicana TaxID=47314 RepID=UPI0011E603EF|nr:uncharacterized protein LOC115763641 isoform X3 [Drosophila novamexicana]
MVRLVGLHLQYQGCRCHTSLSKHWARYTMNFNGINIPQKLVPHNYLQLGLAAQRGRQRQLKELLEKRKLPEHGWRDEEIEELVHQLAALDSNNFAHNVGLGEREARIACSKARGAAPLQLWPWHRALWRSAGGTAEGRRLHAAGQSDKRTAAGSDEDAWPAKLSRLLSGAPGDGHDVDLVPAGAAQAPTKCQICALVTHRSEVLL